MPEPSGNPPVHVPAYATEAFGATLEAVFATLQEPMVILGSDLTIQAANAAFCNSFQLDVRHVIGRKLHDLAGRQWDIPELRRLLSGVIADDATISGYRIDIELGRIGRRVLMVNAHKARGKDGEALIVLAIHDQTEIEVAKEYADKLVDALRDPFLVLDWDLRVKSANRPFYSMFGVQQEETEGRLIYELGNGQWNITRLRELLEDILPASSAFDDFEVEHTFENIGTRVMLLNARRIDHLKLILLVIEDVTETTRAARQQKALLGEAQHRVKNLLMTVRALSRLTAQRSSSLEHFAESFDARLDAMARTQDLLVREPGASALLHEIVLLELQAIGAREESTFTLDGPELRLSDRASHAFAMTVHELATNAGKYGALSKLAANGRVEIRWSGHPVDAGTELHFRWREHGLLTPPCQDKRGFGTSVIESSLPYLFGGTSTLDFHHDGVECHIEVELPPAEAAAGGKEK